MNNLKKNQLALILFCPLILNGCITSLELKNEEEAGMEERLTCMVDGEPFEAANGQGLLAVDFVMVDMVEKENTFLMTLYAVDLPDEGGARAVGFKLGGIDINDLQVGDTFDDWKLETDSGEYLGVLGAVEERPSVQSEEYTLKASSNHTKEIKLTITEIDYQAKTMSGTFNFKALDDEKNIEVEVSEGSFQNISWAD
ncbi:hypothetical protein IFO69_12255 [Echinicola sp. CAU 1574]|uniref:Lipoprotein n=1 Tax=Echinicola arenosa TaxID=2774144 RepID=A0ABR9ALT9_9BACT|nr:DUF6252 family protein [Echinicola arenosa]MBD8489519.1 hypothetical protein [Echinicola arenosa]